MSFGVAIRHGGGRTAQDATGATVFQEVTPDMAQAFADTEAERRTKVQQATLGIQDF